MASSLLSNWVVSHTNPEEYLTVSFTTASSVASIAHSFTASFAKAPVLTGVGADSEDQLDFWVTSNTASGATLNVKSATAATASINATFQFKPDLS